MFNWWLLFEQIMGNAQIETQKKNQLNESFNTR